MFHPGATAVHAFTIPFNKKSIAEIVVSYWQRDDLILEKTLASDADEFDQAFMPMRDWSEEEKEHKSKFFVQFTQDESLLFEDCCNIRLQVNVYTKANSRHAGRVIRLREIGAQLCREVIPVG